MSVQGGTDIWNKFKSSTKSLSTSLSQLSIKPEKDGDVPTATLIHKALVKYYKKQEPFKGYPEWLGHKEEGADDQSSTTKNSSADDSTRSSDSGSRRTAGMAFQKIYSSVQPASKASRDNTNNPGMQFQYNISRSTDQLVESQHSGATWGLPRSQKTAGDRAYSAEASTASSNPVSSAMSQSQLMRERMKKSISRRGTFEL